MMKVAVEELHFLIPCMYRGLLIGRRRVGKGAAVGGWGLVGGEEVEGRVGAQLGALRC
jgi:hypothetical protein